MKQANTYKGKLEWQSEFSHRYACWAKNHNGWAKMKKSNKKLANRMKKTIKRIVAGLAAFLIIVSIVLMFI